MNKISLIIFIVLISILSVVEIGVMCAVKYEKNTSVKESHFCYQERGNNIFIADITDEELTLEVIAKKGYLTDFYFVLTELDDFVPLDTDPSIDNAKCFYYVNNELKKESIENFSGLPYGWNHGSNYYFNFENFPEISYTLFAIDREGFNYYNGKYLKYYMSFHSSNIATEKISSVKVIIKKI